MAAHHLHIFIIDDNQDILDVLRLILTNHAFKVSAQHHVSDFIIAIREMSPDLIILDQHLGWADGCDLCAMVKTVKELKHIPVIMFSAYHKAMNHCLSAGADAFLAKPFEMTALLHTIYAFQPSGQLH